MANENVPAPAPTRSDDQILPFAAWVPIGKSNHLDEDWFTLDANLLREALEITPIDQAHPFVSPPSGDAIMDFVNELGYSEGIITNTNVDYAELMWEEFVKAIQTFLTDKANLGSPTKKDRKDKPHKVAAEKGGKKKSASTKQPKPKPAIEKSSKPAPTSKPKVTKEKTSKASTAKPPKLKPTNEKSTKATPLQKAGKGKVSKVRNVKSSFQLVDESDEEPADSEPVPEPEQEGAGSCTYWRCGNSRTCYRGYLTTPYSKRKGRTSTTDEASTGPSAQPLDDTSANIIRDYPSLGDTETGARSDKISNGGDTKIVQITEELGEDVEKQENVKEKMVELDQD
ncbi:hypothetical protein Tco_1288883 [Tanacetum coccineum]